MPWYSRFFAGSTLTSDEQKKLAGLEKAIGYFFRDKNLFKRALTHKSFANEKRLSALEQNERLEFLGDAVMELVVSDLLMTRFFPRASEGELSKMRASLVNETSLAELARTLGLGDFLFLGRGEDQCQGREKDSLLSDAFEALLGAIYLDSDYEAVFKIIEKHFGPVLQRSVKEDINRDFKTRLQEEAQGMFKVAPRYVLVSESGPDHDKVFEVNLILREEVYGRGQGKSKKQAEQMAAQEALEKLKK